MIQIYLDPWLVGIIFLLLFAMLFMARALDKQREVIRKYEENGLIFGRESWFKGFLEKKFTGRQN